MKSEIVESYFLATWWWKRGLAMVTLSVNEERSLQKMESAARDLVTSARRLGTSVRRLVTPARRTEIGEVAIRNVLSVEASTATVEVTRQSRTRAAMFA